MEGYHVVDVLINNPHVKETIMLPAWIRHITGVLFFPVIPPADIPDYEPLGTVGLSLEYERLNVVTNQKIYKKTPVFYEAIDYKTAQGEVFLDKGYNKNDFFQCNDLVSGNSFIIFKYANRKMIIPNTGEEFNANYNRLLSLRMHYVRYHSRNFIILEIETDGDIIRIRTDRWGLQYEIHKNQLNTAIYQFLDPLNNDKPFFENDNDGEETDDPFVMKIIIRYQYDNK